MSQENVKLCGVTIDGSDTLAQYDAGGAGVLAPKSRVGRRLWPGRGGGKPRFARADQQGAVQARRLEAVRLQEPGAVHPLRHGRGDEVARRAAEAPGPAPTAAARRAPAPFWCPLARTSAHIDAHPRTSDARNDAYPCLRHHRFTRERSLVRNQPRPWPVGSRHRRWATQTSSDCARDSVVVSLQ